MLYLTHVLFKNISIIDILLYVLVKPNMNISMNYQNFINKLYVIIVSIKASKNKYCEHNIKIISIQNGFMSEKVSVFSLLFFCTLIHLGLNISSSV